MKNFIPPRHRILKLGDPILREVAEEVAEFNGELFELVKRLEKAAAANRGIGAAAPQIGVNKRVFTWNHPSIGVGHIVNPKVVYTSGCSVQQEGCLSIPGYFFDLERPSEVIIEGLDISERPALFAAGGLHARLILHEMDHLDGILIVDQVDDEQWESYREYHARKTGAPCPSDWRQKVGDGHRA